MKRKHYFFGYLSFYLKKLYLGFIGKIKNFKKSYIKKKHRIKHIANYLITKDGIKFYSKKFIFNLNFIRYKTFHLIKSLIKNTKNIVNTGYLSFTIILYIILSIFFFLLSYNLWVQSYGTVKIPDFSEMKVLEAVEQIQSLHLLAVVESRYSNLPYGSIISQYPKAGHVLKQQRKVKLIVSKGLEYSFLDDFSGWTLFAVKQRVRELNELLKREIKIEIINEEFSDVFEKGLVISQQPEASTDLNLIDTIKIVISKGKMPDSYLMPNLVGKKIEDAQKEIDSIGLILDIQYIQVEDLDKVGIVLQQTPSPNENISKGNTITVVVGQKKL